MRPRVLEVLFSFRTGGSEIVGLELAQQLIGAGVEVLCTAVDGMDGPLRTQCERLGIPIVDLGFPVRDLFRRNGFNPALARRLRALHLDAIHLQHFLTLQKIGLAARVARVPRIVVTEHSDAPYREYLGQRLRLHFVWRLAHRITVVHEEMTAYLGAQFHIPASRFVVIPNGIDVRQWHRMDREARRAELGLGQEFTFIFVGRLAPLKRVPDLIRVFLAAQTAFARPAKLLIVGDGEEMSKCRTTVGEHPAGHSVLFLGEQTDIRRLMAAADVLVLNSESEGLPRALIEAMCVGLPAISTAVGGIPAVLRDHGWLTRSADPESLRSALLEAASDPQRTAALGARARDFVCSQFGYGDVTLRYLRVLGLATAAGADCRSHTEM